MGRAFTRGPEDASTLPCEPEWLSGRVPAARSARPGVSVLAWLVAIWCLGFAAVNLVFEVTDHFGGAAFVEYAPGLSVMDWFAFALKLLGAAVALVSVSRLPGRVSVRMVGVLVWGAAALLGLYSLGSVVEAIGMLTGLSGSADQITVRSVAYVAFFALGAIGYGVLARSFSQRYQVQRSAVVLGVLGAPLLLGLLLGVIPALLVALGLLPATP